MEKTEPFGRLTTSFGEVEIRGKQTLDIAKELLNVLEKRIESWEEKEELEKIEEELFEEKGPNEEFQRGDVVKLREDAHINRPTKSNPKMVVSGHDKDTYKVRRKAETSGRWYQESYAGKFLKKIGEVDVVPKYRSAVDWSELELTEEQL